MDGPAPADDPAAKTRRLQEALSAVLDGKYGKSDLENVLPAVLSRNKKLGGYIHQLVRVVRLAGIVSGTEKFREFFFSGSKISSSYFEGLIVGAIRENRLPPDVVRLLEEEAGGKGKRGSGTIEFTEAEMGATASKQVPFKLYFGNLPPLTAILEIIWYALGSELLDSILKPLLARNLDPKTFWEERKKLEEEKAKKSKAKTKKSDTEEKEKTMAGTIAGDLESVFSSWLDDVLGKSTAARHAVVIQRYLINQGVLKAGSISDDVIFDFWSEHAQSNEASESGDTSDSGFRRYRNSAVCVLRFARALELNVREQELDVDVLDRSQKVDYSDDPRDFFKQKPKDMSEWMSPIVGLFPPRDMHATENVQVKWLKSEDQLDSLRNFIHGCPEAADSDRSALIPEVARNSTVANVIAYAKLSLIDDDNRGSLMGVDRFKLRFCKTLLRVDVFGKAQNDMSKVLKDNTKESRAGKAKASKLDQKVLLTLLPDSSADKYDAVQLKYTRIHEQIVDTILASIGHFAQRQGNSAALGDLEPEAISAVSTLILRVGSKNVIRFFLSARDDSLIVNEEDMTDDENAADANDAILERIAANVRAGLVTVFKAEDSGNPAVDSFIRDIKNAGNDRAGFKDGDYLNRKFRTAHTEGAQFLVQLLDELEELEKEIKKTLQRQPGVFAEDCAKFAPAFQRIYGE